MKTTIKLSKVADSVDEVVVDEVLVATGDAVRAGDPIMRVETDKALVEVPAPVAGTVVEVLVAEGAEIPTGTPLVVVET